MNIGKGQSLFLSIGKNSKKQHLGIASLLILVERLQKTKLSPNPPRKLSSNLR